jgi:hypothetical protein
MKALKSMISLLLMLVMISCTDKSNNDPWPFYSYDSLWISVQDALGKDLIKGIGYDWWKSDVVPEEEAEGGSVKSNLYTLNIIFPEPCMDYYAPPNGAILDPVSAPQLGLKKWNGYYYLELITSSRKYFYDPKYHSCPPAVRTTFNLKCPYVFGNDAVHEIVSYWKPEDNNPYYQVCESVVLDGKKYTTNRFCYGREDGLLNIASIIVTPERK